MRPKAALVASDAPKAALGASDAPKATLGRLFRTASNSRRATLAGLDPLDQVLAPAPDARGLLGREVVEDEPADVAAVRERRALGRPAAFGGQLDPGAAAAGPVLGPRH